MHGTSTRFTRENQPDPARRARGGATQRSKFSNGKKLLPGIDGRSPAGRRYRDLIRAFESEVGGVISETERTLIRQAAALTLRAEEMQGAIIRGDPVDGDLLIRLSGTARRLLETVAAKAGKRKVPAPSLQDHLARRAAERADSGSDQAA